MNIKKALSLCLAFVVMVSLLIPTASAVNKGIEIESDSGLAYEFLADAEFSERNGALLISNDIAVTTYNVNESYIKETVFIIPAAGYSTQDVKENINSFLATSGAGSKYEEGCDAAWGIRGNLTIYYDRRVNNGAEQVLLTKVSGGYEVLDRQMSVRAQKLTYGCSGTVGNQNATAFPSGASWSYDCPKSWKYCDVMGLTITVGANCDYTIKRAGNDTTWTLSVTNNLYNDINA